MSGTCAIALVPPATRRASPVYPPGGVPSRGAGRGAFAEYRERNQMRDSTPPCPQHLSSFSVCFTFSLLVLFFPSSLLHRRAFCQQAHSLNLKKHKSFSLRSFFLFLCFLRLSLLSCLFLTCCSSILKAKRFLMAKFLSQVYTTIRGSVGGITYTANQFQALVARARVSPVNPQTTRQTQIRSAFSGAVQSWSGLTNAQRQAWDDYASTLIFEGPTGSYSVPGRQVFIGNIAVANYLNAVLGSPAVVAFDPPIIAGFLNIENVSPGGFISIGTGVAFSFTQNGAENVTAFSERSFAFGADRNRFKGPYLSNTLDNIDVVAPASGLLEFPGLTEDLIYFMNPRFITSQAPFRLSASFNLRDVAITNVV